MRCTPSAALAGFVLIIACTLTSAQEPAPAPYLNAASESYRQVGDGEARVAAFASHAGVRAWLGDKKGAQRIWSEVESQAVEHLADYTGQSLGRVVWAFAGLGSWQTATVLAMRIRSAKRRGKALGYIAATRVLAGDFDAARALYRDVADQSDVELGVAGSIVEALALKGQAEEGLAFVRERGQPAGSGGLLTLLAHAASASGREDLLADALSGIGDFGTRVGALMFAIDGLWHGGHRETAHRVLSDTIVEINSSGDLHLVIDSYPMIAAMLYRWGDTTEAATVSDHALNAFPTWNRKHGPDHVRTDHTDILGGIDAIADLRGRPSPADIDRGTIADDALWDKAQVGRAMIYAMAGRHEMVVMSIDQIGESLTRGATAVDVVKLLLGGDYLDKAAAVAAKIGDPAVRGRAFDLIALAAQFGTVPYHLDW